MAKRGENRKRGTHQNKTKHREVLRDGKDRKERRQKVKTVAEVARDCKVSKTTINRYIVALDMKKDIETDQGGTMLLTEEQEQQIKNALKKYEPTRNARNAPKREKESGAADRVPEQVRELKRQIAEKEKQLEEKNAEIERLHGIIEKHQALLETNQQLLDQQQKLMLVSQQLAIESKQHKPGLLARLFRKDKPSDQGTESGADQATAETNDQ